MAGGVDGLREHCKLTPGVPLKPMLAKPTKAITEVLDRFEGKEFTCEYKYDGERAQVHLLENGEIAVFSRNSENMSAKYPDLVEQVPRVSFSFILLRRRWLINQSIKEGVKSFVVDAEAVAYDLETKKLLPFQDLSRRKRKDVRTEDITVRVHLFAFDLLYLNGEVSLLLRDSACLLTCAESAVASIEETPRAAAGAFPSGRGRIRFREILRWPHDRRDPDILGRKCQGWLRRSDGQDVDDRRFDL